MKTPSLLNYEMVDKRWLKVWARFLAGYEKSAWPSVCRIVLDSLCSEIERGQDTAAKGSPETVTHPLTNFTDKELDKHARQIAGYIIQDLRGAFQQDADLLKGWEEVVLPLLRQHVKGRAQQQEAQHVI